VSQHQVQIQSPNVGNVLVTVGYDPILNEAFLNYMNDQHQYMSDSGLQAREIQKVAQAQLGVSLPQQIIDGVQSDIADLRMGARDVGRRIRRYEADGTLVDNVSW